MIKFENVSFKYKTSDLILNNLSFEINEGEFITIIGQNGTGKSTILNLMAGIIKPIKGKILIDDIDSKSKKDFKNLRKKVGMVFQNPDGQILFPRVYEDIEFALKNLDIDNRKERIETALNIVNMKEFENKDTYELSLGQKQRINIASVLAIKPKYIILDEPTTMIDSIEKEQIYRCLKELKKQKYTIIFVTNNINEILLADKVFILEDKEIKHIINKNEIINNIELLEESKIKVPDIVKIVHELKENNINLDMNEWTIEEMIKEIVKSYKRKD